MKHKVDEETRKKWNDDCKYEDRYIALLDIMGFSNLVYDENNNSIFAGILSTTFLLPQEKDAEGTPFARVKTAIISDTLVISASKETPTALDDIISVVYSIFTSFLDEGIVVRGGISCGKLFHQNNVVFGPAMVEAHQLEQDIAIYPRIILQPDAQLNFFGSNHNTNFAFVQDFDGIFYLDLYSELIYRSYKENDVYGPNMIRTITTRWLDDPKAKERIKQKYLWIREHFNYALKGLLDEKQISSEAYEAWLLDK